MIVSNTPIGQQGKLEILIKLSILWCQTLDTGLDEAVSFQSRSFVSSLVSSIVLGLDILGQSDIEMMFVLFGDTKKALQARPLI